MKTRIIVLTAATVGLCILMVMAYLSLNPRALRAMRFQWQQMVADTRTVKAAIRYLLTPELPVRHDRSLASNAAPTAPVIATAQLTGPSNTGITNTPT